MSDTDTELSRAQIVKQLDASLKRLGTDYIDLYQCHRFDEETPLEETMEALTEAVRQGKTRYVYSVHVRTRKSFGLMTRKLSVTESRKVSQFLGTLSRKKSSVASANCPHVA
jgi:aryl-alcohol dehydrogenase-like predicted oxidoreductase